VDPDGACDCDGRCKQVNQVCAGAAREGNYDLFVLSGQTMALGSGLTDGCARGILKWASEPIRALAVGGKTRASSRNTASDCFKRFRVETHQMAKGEGCHRAVRRQRVFTSLTYQNDGERSCVGETRLNSIWTGSSDVALSLIPRDRPFISKFFTWNGTEFSRDVGPSAAGADGGRS